MVEASRTPRSNQNPIKFSSWLKFLPFILSFVFVLIATPVCTVPAQAQSTAEIGKLKIHVHPKQAYVFVDGKAIRDGSQTIELPAGEHKVGVYNYGYLSKVQEVNIAAHDTTRLDVALESSGPQVSGLLATSSLRGRDALRCC